MFHDDVFTPDVDSYGRTDVEMIDDIPSHGSSTAAKISPALKRKAATEEAKKEKYVSQSFSTPNLTHEAHRVKRAKGISSDRMNPTMKKPSGKRSNHNIPAAATHAETPTVMTQDEDETDHDADEESEDIKPTAGSFARSSSVSYSLHAANLADIV